MTSKFNRRRFVAAAATSGLLIGRLPSASGQEKPAHQVERLGVGVIGLRYQGSVDAHKAAIYGDIVAVCDADKNVRDQAKAAFGSTPGAYEDYRDLLERQEVDVPAGIGINEIRIDQSGSDNDEYFEIVGPEGTDLNGFTYIVIQ